MKLPLSWIKEYIDIDLNTEELSDTLTMLGLEVEGIEPEELPFSNVVVAKVIEAKPHPEADKLQIAEVFDGTDTYQVVCAAPNCREGLYTAFARTGGWLLDSEGKKHKIKKGKLRGVESFGMLCSGKELQVSSDNDGIMELDSTYELGTNLSSIYGDTILDIALTPNLNYCSSVLGIARELSAALRLPIKQEAVQVKEIGEKNIDNYTSVTVEETELCPRYSCRLIKNVKIAPSPTWLSKRLEACGVRSINNVVDATNYVLMELGHPLHAFDFDQLDGKKIIVKCATEGEEFTTLDSQKRTLRSDSLMICDGAKSTAIAGVMGGELSEVSDNTTNVLLESAYFNPSSVRRTSKAFDLSTEASKRYERGTDPNNVLPALEYASDLIAKLSGGEVVPGIIDVKDSDFPKQKIACRIKRVNQILGTNLSLAEVEEIFVRLGFELESDSEGVILTNIPTFRVDISREIDLIEEVARIYGYNNLPKPRARYSSSTLPHSPLLLFERHMRDRLLAEGLQEFLKCDLISPKQDAFMSESIPSHLEAVSVLNPTSADQSVLRRSLLPGLLELTRHNLDRQNQEIAGFEIGRCHYRINGKFQEDSHAAVLLSGSHTPKHWNGGKLESDFFDIKGICENLLNHLGINEYRFSPSNKNVYHPGRQAKIFHKEELIGHIGEVHPTLLRELDIGQRVYYAEMNLHILYQLQAKEWKMQALPAYPGSERDWTITISESISIEQVMEALRKTPSRLLEEINLLDIYRSDKLGKNNKNVTFRFTYRDRRKTVSQESVEREHGRITEGANKLLKEEILG
ncbi:MAG: phenylalanine--tRNA ligase subunit beta [Waddliaceae bacterium]|nr:phenylalanine--tRNA ligase subunit beta [Waddliaceae bacterium]